MIKRRTCVKDPSGDDVYYQQNDEAVHDKEKAISVTEKDEETWKLDKRIEDLEKASVYPAVAKERTSQMKQNHEEDIIEKYEKDLEDTRAREQHYARNAAILSKELKQEKLRHSETLKKLQETEQKLQNELRRKDNEKIQQLKKSKDFAKAELGATTADEKIMPIEQTKESSVIVDAHRKYDVQTMKQATWVSTSDSAKSQDRRDKVKKIQTYIDDLEASKAKLILQCEEAKDLLKKCSASNNPEPFRDPELKMNCGNDASAKSDDLVDLDLDLALKLAKCHEIFVCPLEVGCEKLSDHLAAEDYMIARLCKIPGKKIHSDLPEDNLVRHRKYIPPHRRVAVRPEHPLWKMNMFGKSMIGGMTECLYRLH